MKDVQTFKLAGAVMRLAVIAKGGSDAQIFEELERAAISLVMMDGSNESTIDLIGRLLILARVAALISVDDARPIFAKMPGSSSWSGLEPD